VENASSRATSKREKIRLKKFHKYAPAGNRKNGIEDKRSIYYAACRCHPYIKPNHFVYIIHH
jgi:hypothetical protein